MNIAKTIDHTLLKPEATAADIEALCREARQYGFASVCVNTCYVPLASALLRGSGVKVCCTVGFPLGAMAPKAKAFEAAQAVADGAEEVDMVLWIGALRQGDTAAVQADIEGVVNACHPKAIVKVILETCLLTESQIETACRPVSYTHLDVYKRQVYTTRLYTWLLGKSNAGLPTVTWYDARLYIGPMTSLSRETYVS